MDDRYKELLNIFSDFFVMANSPKRDAKLLEEAGVDLDRALYPLLVGIENLGPIGVVHLAEIIGRDYTTVSRQVAKLEELGLIKRQNGKKDSRVKEAFLTAKGRGVTKKLSVVREDLIDRALGQWGPQDLKDVTRLMRKLVDDLKSV